MVVQVRPPATGRCSRRCCGYAVGRPERPNVRARIYATAEAPVVATLATLLCLYLALNLVGETWVRFVVWMLVGFVVYFAYSRGHSRLNIRTD